MKFARPVNNRTPRITTNFSSGHPAKDYAEPNGTPLYAKQAGKIIAVKNDERRQWLANTTSDPFRRKNSKGQWISRNLITEDYGNYIIIQHAEGFSSLDAHMLPFSATVKVGDTVKIGQKIGEIGSTGNSTGNHVHDELRLWGTKVNLANYFDSSFTGYFTASTTPVGDDEKLNRIRTAINDGGTPSNVISKIREILK